MLKLEISPNLVTLPLSHKAPRPSTNSVKESFVFFNSGILLLFWRDQVVVAHEKQSIRIDLKRDVDRWRRHRRQRSSNETLKVEISFYIRSKI